MGSGAGCFTTPMIGSLPLETALVHPDQVLYLSQDAVKRPVRPGSDGFPECLGTEAPACRSWFLPACRQQMGDEAGICHGPCCALSLGTSLGGPVTLPISNEQVFNLQKNIVLLGIAAFKYFFLSLFF